MKIPVFLAIGLAFPSVIAQQPGSFVVAGNTLVSAMMVCLVIHFLTPFLIPPPSQMFVGSSDKVYIIDKVEGNAEQINGHSAYASVW